MHGLWQAHTRRGARRRAQAGRALPDRGARDGRALGAAAQGAGRRGCTRRSSRGRTSAGRPACTPCPGPRSATSAAIAPRTPVCFVPNGVDLAPFDDLPAASGPGGRVPRARRASSSLLFFGRLHVKKGLDLLAEALARLRRRPPRAAPAARRQRRRRARRRSCDRIAAERALVARDLGRPRLGRARPAGLGGGRRLRPAQLQRGVQHGDPRSPGLPAPRASSRRPATSPSSPTAEGGIVVEPTDADVHPEQYVRFQADG